MYCIDVVLLIYLTFEGCLLVKNSSSHVLKKVYFGGGTVEVAGVDEFVVNLKRDVSQRSERIIIISLNIKYE